MSHRNVGSDAKWKVNNVRKKNATVKPKMPWASERETTAARPSEREIRSKIIKNSEESLMNEGRRFRRKRKSQHLESWRVVVIRKRCPSIDLRGFSPLFSEIHLHKKHRNYRKQRNENQLDFYLLQSKVFSSLTQKRNIWTNIPTLRRNLFYFHGDIFFRRFPLTIIKKHYFFVCAFVDNVRAHWRNFERRLNGAFDFIKQNSPRLT